MAESAERAPLTSAEFERFRHAAETYREDLVVSLAGLVGLRPAEIGRLRVSDLHQFRRSGTPCYLLSVREDDEGTTRTAYVPRGVAHDLQKFHNADRRGADATVFDVSARRIQMLVAAVSDRTTTERLQSVSSRDLRECFAHRLLVEQEVHPRIVQAVGGWSSLESLASFFEQPTERDILEACDTAVGQTASDSGGRGSPASEHPTANGSDRRFTRRTDELVECLEALGRRLVEAGTHTEVETAACVGLAACFEGVWFCDENGDPRESAGAATVSAASIRETLDGANVVESLADGEEDTLVVDTAEHGSRVSDDETLCVVAVRSSDAVHGYLCVTGRSFDVTARRLLADAGRRVGQTLVAVERKQLLLADTGVEVTIQSTSDESLFVDASNSLGCRFELDGVVPVAAGSLLHFVTASGASVSDVLDTVGDAEGVTDARLIRDYGEESLFEFVVSKTSLASIVVEAGGSVRTLTVDDGTAHVTGVFSGHADVRGIVEQFTATFSDSQLLSKHEVEEPVQTTARVDHVVHEELTEKQRAVLRAAFLSGYFEWPRGSTAEELAASMDVASPTLHNHLRKAQQKLLTAVFDETRER
jgi:hypothetical protein